VEWLGVVALGILLLISRRLILGRWRRYELSHRKAAALWASVFPLLLVVSWLFRGIDSLNQLLLLSGLVGLTFGSTFAIALYFLRAFGGEMDPPSSSGYRHRP
jgi:fucose permease